ncbi:hypothetical protein [Streptomyces sp. PU-14G]|uniref:hypothetical protein n=1 Tax=Streptomyces sp. PU-14G TaxID=2800808 RepID=UPI0034DE24B5
MGSAFVQGHAAVAAAALRAVEELRLLPHQLMSLGYGPERSVVQTAVEEAGWGRCTRCPYVGPSASHTCTANAPSADQSLASPAPTTASPADSGIAQDRRLPGPDDSTWEAVPLHLCQQLRVPAQELVSPARGALAAPKNRAVLRAVRAASQMRMTGAHWTLLLTTDREIFGGPRSRRAQRLYAVLEEVAALHAPPAREQGAGLAVRSEGVAQTMEPT